MPRNMYGAALQNYVVQGNTVYPADHNGLITNVLDSDVDQLVALRCIDEAAWLKLQTAHPSASTPSVGTSGQVQMSNGSGAFLASQITDNGTVVIIANGQIETPAATPIKLISDTGVALGSFSTEGQDTINAGGLYVNGNPVATVLTTRTVSGTTDTIATGDNGNAVYYTSGSAVAVSVPSGLGANFNCLWVQGGAGKLTFTGSGATVNGESGHTSSSGNQWAQGSLYAPVANTLVLGGSTS
jgi:hypothetical protein